MEMGCLFTALENRRECKNCLHIFEKPSADKGEVVFKELSES